MISYLCLCALMVLLLDRKMLISVNNGPVYGICCNFSLILTMLFSLKIKIGNSKMYVREWEWWLGRRQFQRVASCWMTSCFLLWLDLTVELLSVGFSRPCWLCWLKRPVCDQWGLYLACCSIQLSAGLHWSVCERTDTRARLDDRVRTVCWVLCRWSMTKSQCISYLKLDASPKVYVS